MHLSSKALRFEHRCDKLVFFTRSHLTAVRPCNRHAFKKTHRSCSQAKKHENMKPAEARQLWKGARDFRKRCNLILINLNFLNTFNCAKVKWKSTEKPRSIVFDRRTICPTLFCARLTMTCEKTPTCRRKRNPVTKSEKFKLTTRFKQPS